MTQNQNQNQNQTALDYPRLSTHILLGDHLRERDPSQWMSENGSCGCALGGAIISVGAMLIDRRGYYRCGKSTIYNRWPWLGKTAPFNNQMLRVSLFPSDDVPDELSINFPWGSYGPYTADDDEPNNKTFLWAISDLFIRVHYDTLTMESLVDQVRLWEEVYDDQLIAALAADSNHGQGDRDLVADAESIIEPVSVR